MRVLTMWAPHASLCVTRQPCECGGEPRAYATCPAHCCVKRFETRPRPCPPHLIGQRIAIHQAARKPDVPLVGDWMVCPRPDATWYLNQGPNVVDVPLGAIVGTAVIARNLPIVGMFDDMPRRGAHVLADPDSDRLLIAPYPYFSGACEAITDQRPYGDWTPGRHAYELVDVEPLAEPVLFKGGQGWSKTWEPS